MMPEKFLLLDGAEAFASVQGKFGVDLLAPGLQTARNVTNHHTGSRGECCGIFAGEVGVRLAAW